MIVNTLISIGVSILIVLVFQAVKWNEERKEPTKESKDA